MARNRENARRINRTSQRKYAEKLRMRRAPTMTDIGRALANALSEHGRTLSAATPEARAAIMALLESTYKVLVARGFREVEIRHRLALMMKPKPKPMAAMDTASAIERAYLNAIRAEGRESRS